VQNHLESNVENHQNTAILPGLEMINEITAWWQRSQIELQCRYTARLMKRFGCFEQCVAEHFRFHPMPASIDEMASQFLSSIEQSSDPLLSAVARFELARLSPPSANQTRIIFWDRDPDQVMVALNGSTNLPRPELNMRYVMRIGAGVPGGMSCTREKAPSWDSPAMAGSRVQ